ncbi:MAG: hypothetical protein ACLVEJ_00955 [Parabacteroides sp.]
MKTATLLETNLRGHMDAGDAKSEEECRGHDRWRTIESLQPSVFSFSATAGGFTEQPDFESLGVSCWLTLSSYIGKRLNKSMRISIR